MDYQETFNQVYLNILRQGRPSIDQKSKTCQFHGKFGTKCAIGWLIPDKTYTPVLEYFSIDNLIDRRILSASFHDSNFLYRLQKCHDLAWDLYADPCADTPSENLKFVSRFKEYMKEVAINYHLIVPQ